METWETLVEPWRDQGESGRLAGPLVVRASRGGWRGTGCSPPGLGGHGGGHDGDRDLQRRDESVRSGGAFPAPFSSCHLEPPPSPSPHGYLRPSPRLNQADPAESASHPRPHSTPLCPPGTAPVFPTVSLGREGGREGTVPEAAALKLAAPPLLPAVSAAPPHSTNQ